MASERAATTRSRGDIEIGSAVNRHQEVGAALSRVHGAWSHQFTEMDDLDMVRDRA